VIETEELNAGYGRVPVLYDINFSANFKEITVVVGPNGSGKSTLLKTIMGLTTMYSGAIKLEGKDVTELRPHERAKRGIAYLPQVGSVFSNLSVRENMIMAGLTLEKGELYDRMDTSMNTFPFLKGYLNRKANTLSGGERQMLAMAMALMRRPKVMMFDEPTSNLAPKLAVEVLNEIIELRDKLGLVMILVEQSARKALEIGDKAYLIVAGRFAFEGRAVDLLENKELGKMYLGIKL